MGVHPGTLDIILDSIGALPGWLVLGFFWFKLFDIERPRLYWGVWITQYVVFRSLLLLTFDLWLRVLIDIGNFLVFPFFVSRGSGNLWWRILCIVASLAGTITAEMFMTVGLYISGLELLITEFRSVSDHPLAYCFFQGLLALTFALVDCGLYVLLRRVGHKDSDPTCLWFALFLVAQSAMVIVVLSVCQYGAWGDTSVMVSSFVFALASLALDAMVMGAAARASAARLRRQQNAALKEQLAACMEHYGEVAAEEERLARFRHDLRGELQAVDALVASGNYQRALALVGELEEQLNAKEV